MISIIVGTNRKGSETQKFANILEQILQKKEQQTQMLCLDALPVDFFSADMYVEPKLTPELKALQDKFLINADKFLFVVPEYNGSYPGILKLFIDVFSVRLRNESYSGKKACITGVASGRAGNLRGMEHLTGVLNYLNTAVLPNRLPISSIKKLMNAAGEITDADTIKVMSKQMDEFIAF